MESQDLSPSHVDPSRPSLGFPLGTALLLIVIFSLSGFFSCCYHWDKLRSLHQSVSQETDLEADVQSPPSKPKLSISVLKQKQGMSMPVLMPGDEMPTFIALPCPCERARKAKVAVKAGKPPPIAVPLYYP